ncbi:hypothetical protein HKX48_005865 [Thoreauomyces humboldtii]|nr:hypothetical protein HKX48_005865 [Thoreauomyces humboldtii]
MPSDLESGQISSGTWEKDRLSLEILSDDISTLLLEKRHAERTRADSSTTRDLDSQIRSSLATLKDGIKRIEQRLSAEEDSGDRTALELRGWEEAVLTLSQQYDRLDAMAKAEDGTVTAEATAARKALFTRRAGPETTRFSEPEHDSDGDDDGAGGSLQLQQRIMDDQDTQLDELAATIGRQKHIGLMINEELDLHVELLEDTEGRVDATHRRLEGAGRRLSQVLDAAAHTSTGNTFVAILILVLIVVIVIAKHS